MYDIWSRKFYHLTQATWGKIQTHGLVHRYREEEDAKLFCDILDGLVFLPVDDVPEGMTYLWELNVITIV